MTVTFAARLTDNDGVTLVDFANGNIKLAVTRYGLPPADEYPYDHLFNIVSKRTASVTARRVTVQKIMRSFQDASAAIEKHHAPDYVWFEFYEEGELPKRAIVFGGNIGLAGSPLQQGTKATQGTITITRGPWESTTPITITDTITLRGAAMELPAAGDMPGRISKLELADISDTLTVYDFFLGIREYNRGTADFDPFIDISTTSGTLVLNTESTVASKVLDTVFAGDDWTHWQGRYKTYLRGTCNHALCRVRMRVSSSHASALVPGTYTDSDYVENGAFDVYLGTIDIPLAGGNKEHSSTIIGNTELEFLAMPLDTTGTATITFTHLVLVPERRCLRSDDARIQSALNDAQYIYTEPDDEIVAMAQNRWDNAIDQITPLIDSTLDNWNYPPKGGVFVFCYEGTSTYTLDVEMEVYPRWHLYRTRAQ